VAGKIEAKGGVTIPGDLHGGTLSLRDCGRTQQ
jgi:hypothetical protein